MGNNGFRNEYEELYGDRPSFGYLFYSKNGYLSKSYALDENEILKIKNGKGNPQNLFVYCELCDTYMDFVKGEGLLKGSWKCPKCGKKVRESTPYHKLDQENEKFLEDWNEDEYDEIY